MPIYRSFDRGATTTVSNTDPLYFGKGPGWFRSPRLIPLASFLDVFCPTGTRKWLVWLIALLVICISTNVKRNYQIQYDHCLPTTRDWARY
ncbi:hypothetical protein BJX99DRAFT_231195, partial [Aspergillus californicus]